MGCSSGGSFLFIFSVHGGYGSKMGTQKTLLAKGKSRPIHLWSPVGFSFLTHRRVFIFALSGSLTQLRAGGEHERQEAATTAVEILGAIPRGFHSKKPKGTTMNQRISPKNSIEHLIKAETPNQNKTLLESNS